MSVLFTVLAVILIVIFVLLLSLGLFVALGIFFIIAVIAGILAFLFGSGTGDWSFSTTSTNVDDDVLAIPQKFNECLLGSDPDICRTKFTHWEAKDIEIIRQLSKQVQSDLGRRSPESFIHHSSTENNNGQVTVTLDQETDFEKKDGVREHYQLTSDSQDKKGDLKIKDLKWDY